MTLTSRVICSPMPSVAVGEAAAPARDAISTARPVTLTPHRSFPEHQTLPGPALHAPQTNTAPWNTGGKSKRIAAASSRGAHRRTAPVLGSWPGYPVPDSSRVQGNGCTATSRKVPSHLLDHDNSFATLTAFRFAPMHTLHLVPYRNSKCAKAGKCQHTHTHLSKFWSIQI